MDVWVTLSICLEVSIINSNIDQFVINLGCWVITLLGLVNDKYAYAELTVMHDLLLGIFM
jgi:hypothetical protein